VSDRPDPLERNAEGRQASGTTVQLANPSDLDALLRVYEQLSDGNGGADRAKASDAFEAISQREGVTLLVAEAEPGAGHGYRHPRDRPQPHP